MKDNHKKLLEDFFKQKVQQALPIHGGCTGEVFQVVLEDRSVLAKIDQPERLRCEALGLKVLNEAQSIRAPQPLLQHNDLLAVEWIDSRAMSSSDLPALALGLRKLHTEKQSDFFGFKEDNFIGASKQSNTPELSVSEGWNQFYWRYRLEPQLEAACKQYSFSKRDIEGIKKITFKKLDCVESSCLLHGDLWSGNILVDSKSEEPVLIDPAVYYGDADAEFGIMECFGGFPKEFYQHYFQDSAKIKKFESKIELYKLYHLLNHLNIFGTSYWNQCRKCIENLLNP